MGQDSRDLRCPSKFIWDSGRKSKTEEHNSSKAGEEERSTRPQGMNHPYHWIVLPLGLTTAAAQQQQSTGLFSFAKAEQRLARWSGRGRAERLGGVKLIALIPLHVYHLDPGNYHAECLTPISRQMPRGWKQMGEEQQDWRQDELGQPGENPRGSALGKAGTACRGMS